MMRMTLSISDENLATGSFWTAGGASACCTGCTVDEQPIAHAAHRAVMNSMYFFIALPPVE
jgi:hypothetical protein